MILGLDCSSLLDVRKAGAKFTVHGKPIEPLTYFHDVAGLDLLRLRLWVDPYDEQGHPYGGGTNDYEAFLKLAKEGLAKGYRILLDFHYSDFWCDPSKQFLPKAWRGLDFEQLCAKLNEYTRKTLTDLKNEGIPLYAVQVGNEITNGMLWPFAHLDYVGPNKPREGYDNLCRLLTLGAIAVREIYPEAKVVLHLEKSGDQPTYREFLDQMVAHEVPFDVLGMSYYPYWHGNFEALFANIDFCHKRYGKPIWIVETAYAFTTEMPYEDDRSQEELDAGMAFPFPRTKEGQRDFLVGLLEQAKLHDVGAVLYWEPLWLPLPGLTWATYEGETYTEETHKPLHNESACYCLFDYAGEATPACLAFNVK